VNHLQWRLDEIAGLDRKSIQSCAGNPAAPGRGVPRLPGARSVSPGAGATRRAGISATPWRSKHRTCDGAPFRRRPDRVFAIADSPTAAVLSSWPAAGAGSFRATTIGSSPGTNKWGFGDFYSSAVARRVLEARLQPRAHIHRRRPDARAAVRRDPLAGPAALRKAIPPKLRDALRRRIEGGTGLGRCSYPFSRDPAPASAWNPSPLIRTPDIKREDGNNFFRQSLRGSGPLALAARFRPLHHAGIPWQLFPWDNMAVPRSSASGQVLLRTAMESVLAVQTVRPGDASRRSPMPEKG